MPHVPRMLPVLISDPEMREKVSDTFTSQEFMDNLEGYFVDNIKVIDIPFAKKEHFFQVAKEKRPYKLLVHFANIMALGHFISSYQGHSKTYVSRKNAQEGYYPRFFPTYGFWVTHFTHMAEWIGNTHVL